MKSHNKFSHDDIIRSVFDGTHPTYVCYPFSSFLGNESISSIPVVFRIVVQSEKTTPIDLLASVIERAGKKKPTYDTLNKLPMFFIARLLEAYKKILEEWVDYIYNQLPEVCENNHISHYQWRLFSALGVSQVFGTDKLSYEQKLWIIHNKHDDEKIQMQSMIDLRDSVLPWLNPQLWTSMQTRKKSVRKNVKYEQQRKKLMEGSLEDLDIVT